MQIGKLSAGYPTVNETLHSCSHGPDSLRPAFRVVRDKKEMQVAKGHIRGAMTVLVRLS